MARGFSDLIKKFYEAQKENESVANTGTLAVAPHDGSLQGEHGVKQEDHAKDIDGKVNRVLDHAQ